MVGIHTALEVYGVKSMAELEEFRRERMALRGVSPHISRVGRVMAYVSDNRWVADCLECDGGITFVPGEIAVTCLLCGATYQIEMPPPVEMVAAQELLLRRPPKNRHWFPQRGMKARELEALDIEHESWTAPRTWVTDEVVTSSLMNVHVRDNLLETGPAKVTTAGDVLYATTVNALARLGIGSARRSLRVNAGATAPEWSAKIGSFVPILYLPPGSYLYSQSPVDVWEEIGEDQGYTYLVRFYLDFGNLPATQQANLHAVLWSDGQTGGNWVRLRLRNETDGVGYDYIQTIATVPTYVVSTAPFTLPTSGLKLMTVRGTSQAQEGATQVRVIRAWLELL